MAKANWFQRIEAAKRALERLAQVAQDGSAHPIGTSQIRIAARRNVKVVGNVGQPHATSAGVAQQVAPIRQMHHSDASEGGATREVREGGETGHAPGRT